jgi:hypothetical protein
MQKAWTRLDPLLAAVGACLPDWVSHLFVVYPPSFAYLEGLHDPIPLLLLCLLVATLVPTHLSADRGWAALSLALGAYLHYVMDLLQVHAFPVYQPLFPFSDAAVGLGIYSIEASVWWLPAVILALAVERWVVRGRRRGGTDALGE